MNNTMNIRNFLSSSALIKSTRRAISSLCPVARLGLDDEAFGFRGELQTAKSGDAHRNVGDEAQVVLAAKLVLNGAKDLFNREGLGDFKAAAAGFPRDPHENTSAVSSAATQGAEQRPI